MQVQSKAVRRRAPWLRAAHPNQRDDQRRWQWQLMPESRLGRREHSNANRATRRSEFGRGRRFRSVRTATRHSTNGSMNSKAKSRCATIRDGGPQQTRRGVHRVLARARGASPGRKQLRPSVRGHELDREVERNSRRQNRSREEGGASRRTGRSRGAGASKKSSASSRRKHYPGRDCSADVSTRDQRLIGIATRRLERKHHARLRGR